MSDSVPIFRKVRCRAYLKKESDGIFLRIYENTEFAGIPINKSRWDAGKNVTVKAIQQTWENGMIVEKELADLSECEGEYVEKKYRKRVEEEFEGFLVGITRVITAGRLGTEYDEDYYGGEYGEYHDYYNHIFKERFYEKVGVVYFKNNAKRYVLIDDMEEIKDDK